MINTPMISLLERFMDLASQRHNLTVSNMANIDTPGYHTRDINFHAELQRAVSQGNGKPSPVAMNVSGLNERPDGNNVNLDRESLVMAETQMQYRIATQLIRTEFGRLLSAINEGKQ